MRHSFPKALLLASALFAAPTAYCQVTLDPANPKAFFEIRVKVPGTGLGLGLGMDLDGQPDRFDPAQTSVTMVGNKITVSPLMLGHTDFLPVPLQLDQTLGALPPGNYQVEIVKRGTGRGAPGPVGGTISFTVPARAEAEPFDNKTDLWWDPEESGWGLGLFHHSSNQIFGTLFVYGSDSKPNWYVIPGGQFTDPLHFQGTLYKTNGPYFGGAFNPAAVNVSPAGTAVIDFERYDSTRALINFTIDGVSFVKIIQKQSF